ncbi:hypothetical protein BB558_004788, partial [Smittium angustum]
INNTSIENLSEEQLGTQLLQLADNEKLILNEKNDPEMSNVQIKLLYKDYLPENNSRNIKTPSRSNKTSNSTKPRKNTYKKTKSQNPTNTFKREIFTRIDSDSSDVESAIINISRYNQIQPNSTNSKPKKPQNNPHLHQPDTESIRSEFSASKTISNIGFAADEYVRQYIQNDGVVDSNIIEKITSETKKNKQKNDNNINLNSKVVRAESTSSKAGSTLSSKNGGSSNGSMILFESALSLNSINQPPIDISENQILENRTSEDQVQPSQSHAQKTSNTINTETEKQDTDVNRSIESSTKSDRIEESSNPGSTPFVTPNSSQNNKQNPNGNILLRQYLLDSGLSKLAQIQRQKTLKVSEKISDSQPQQLINTPPPDLSDIKSSNTPLTENQNKINNTSHVPQTEYEPTKNSVIDAKFYSEDKENTIDRNTEYTDLYQDAEASYESSVKNIQKLVNQMTISSRADRVNTNELPDFHFEDTESENSNMTDNTDDEFNIENYIDNEIFDESENDLDIQDVQSSEPNDTFRSSSINYVLEPSSPPKNTNIRAVSRLRGPRNMETPHKIPVPTEEMLAKPLPKPVPTPLHSKISQLSHIQPDDKPTLSTSNETFLKHGSENIETQLPPTNIIHTKPLPPKKIPPAVPPRLYKINNPEKYSPQNNYIPSNTPTYLSQPNSRAENINYYGGQQTGIQPFIPDYNTSLANGSIPTNDFIHPNTLTGTYRNTFTPTSYYVPSPTPQPHSNLNRGYVQSPANNQSSTTLLPQNYSPSPQLHRINSINKMNNPQSNYRPIQRKPSISNTETLNSFPTNNQNTTMNNTTIVGGGVYSQLRNQQHSQMGNYDTANDLRLAAKMFTPFPTNIGMDSLPIPDHESSGATVNDRISLPRRSESIAAFEERIPESIFGIIPGSISIGFKFKASQVTQVTDPYLSSPLPHNTSAVQVVKSAKHVVKPGGKITTIEKTNWNKVDDSIRLINSSSTRLSLDTLVRKQIGRQFSKEPLNLIRAIYSWVTTHIRFDNSPLEGSKKGNIHLHMAELPDVVFEKRISRGPGFAYLFNKMASMLGIDSQVVHGTLKLPAPHPDSLLSGPVCPTIPNHAWNVICIDGEYRFVDSACAITSHPLNDLEVRDDGFFLIPPSQLIYTHFPTDPNLQFLDPIVSWPQFWQLPCVRPSYFQNGIKLLNLTTPHLLVNNNELLPLIISLRNDTLNCYAEVEMYSDASIKEQTNTFLYPSPNINSSLFAQCMNYKGKRMVKVLVGANSSDTRGLVKIYTGTRPYLLSKPRQIELLTKMSSHETSLFGTKPSSFGTGNKSGYSSSTETKNDQQKHLIQHRRSNSALSNYTQTSLTPSKGIKNLFGHKRKASETKLKPGEIPNSVYVLGAPTSTTYQLSLTLPLHHMGRLGEYDFVLTNHFCEFEFYIKSPTSRILQLGSITDFLVSPSSSLDSKHYKLQLKSPSGHPTKFVFQTSDQSYTLKHTLREPGSWVIMCHSDSDGWVPIVMYHCE